MSQNIFMFAHADPSFSNDILNSDDSSKGMNILWKVLSLLLILMLSLVFGLMPSFCKRCLSPKILGIANSFSGGIFMGIALFHLLPEGIENVEEFLKDKDTSWKKIPIPYFLTFLSYSLILFVEKIAFDSHALIDHDVAASSGKDHNRSNEEQELRINKNKDNKGLFQNLIENEKNPPSEEESDSDVEEEALKNVVSSRGKFASFMQIRNSFHESNSNKNFSSAKPDKALLRASQILRKTLNRSHLHEDEEEDDMKFMVNPKNIQTDDEKTVSFDDNKQLSAKTQVKQTSNITPFLLLIALSLHGFFEGLALGIQKEIKDTLFLTLAIIAHKWAEAFTLGISFHKANIPKNTLTWMIIIFSIFTPLGISLGLILTDSSKIVEGIILSLSAGTFVYVAASEVIVEEFAVTKYRYSKFLSYLIGGVFVGFLAVLEKIYGDE